MVVSSFKLMIVYQKQYRMYVNFSPNSSEKDESNKLK